MILVQVFLFYFYIFEFKEHLKRDLNFLENTNMLMSPFTIRSNI